MKSGPLLLLAAVLIVTVINLLVSLGVFGPGGSSGEASILWEYRVVNVQEMDAIGYKAVAADVGVEPNEEGKMDLPKEKLLTQNLIPRTLEEIQKDGWQLLTIELTQGGNLFVFRRPKQ